ncbi:HDOD domain-containing protein [Algicola sagamiensis]|uniref:HDOD domain-containing protein n=1 Tax=Algicola sagamiensis TaxID=163869 RepID=UPI00036DD651|nr:HDOD domain-containing protein [Algicola sagamiensis]
MAEPVDMMKIDKILDGFSIPPRPDLLKDIDEELKQEEPNIRKISNLIGQDIGISGFTLKVVNSPLFSLPRKINSIEHACSYLGIDRVVKLVNSVILRFKLSEGKEDPFTTRLWNSSSAVGNAALVLAEHFDLGEETASDCYTLGLFHNAGKALIIEQSPDYPEVLDKAYRQSNQTIADIEETEIESSHEVLGFLLAQSWGLSHELCNVIAYHHNHHIMMATGEAQEKQIFCILKLAEHMTGLSEYFSPGSNDQEWGRHHQTILDYLEIEDFQLADIGEELKSQGVDNIYST